MLDHLLVIEHTKPVVARPPVYGATMICLLLPVHWCQYTADGVRADDLRLCQHQSIQKQTVLLMIHPAAASGEMLATAMRAVASPAMNRSDLKRCCTGQLRVAGGSQLGGIIQTGNMIGLINGMAARRGLLRLQAQCQP